MVSRGSLTVGSTALVAVVPLWFCRRVRGKDFFGNPSIGVSYDGGRTG
jgi:hypothetical protein